MTHEFPQNNQGQPHKGNPWEVNGVITGVPSDEELQAHFGPQRVGGIAKQRNIDGPFDSKIAPTRKAYEKDIVFIERVKVGKEEPAICAVIDLSPSDSDDDVHKKAAQTERLIVLDVGFKQTTSGDYGPYDIDGTGTKRYFSKPNVIANIKEVPDPNDPEKTVKATYIMEVDDDERVILGRDYPSADKLGFTNNNRISKEHAFVDFGAKGKLTVIDEKSTNGTEAVGAAHLISEAAGDFDYTTNVADYVHGDGKGHLYKSEEEQAGWGHGMFGNRPIIARDTPVNGGVYPVGGKGGEALVIDDKRYPKQLNDVYRSVEERIKNTLGSESAVLGGLKQAIDQKAGHPGEGSMELKQLQAIFAEVFDTLKYDLEATEELARDSQKIALNDYISEGVGVCRTQAVLCAYLTERLIDNGMLNGRVSIDRNINKVIDGDDKAHAWARYTDADGNVFILDPAQKYVGKLEDVTDRNWDYRRTSDMVRELVSAGPTINPNNAINQVEQHGIANDVVSDMEKPVEINRNEELERRGISIGSKAVVIRSPKEPGGERSLTTGATITGAIEDEEGNVNVRLTWKELDENNEIASFSKDVPLKRFLETQKDFINGRFKNLSSRGSVISLEAQGEK